MIKQNYLEVFINTGDRVVIKTGEDIDEMIVLEKEDIQLVVQGLQMCLEELEQE